MVCEALMGKHSADVEIFINCMCLIQMRQQRDFSIREQCNSVTLNKGSHSRRYGESSLLGNNSL
jgi:hypothetical protein